MLARMVFVAGIIFSTSTLLRACPFCPALEPTLAQLREDSAVCLLGETRAANTRGSNSF